MGMDQENQEKPAIRVKGVGDSLWVAVDSSLTLNTLQSELKKVFDRLKLKHSVENTRVVLDPGDDAGHDYLLDSLGAFLKTNYGIGTVSPPPKKQLPQTDPQTTPQTGKNRQKDMAGAWRYRRSEVLMMTGRVRSGQKVEASKHLVLLGNVNPGGQVIAGGDILIMGSLRGTAKAGQPENEEAIILALDFQPSQVHIGGYVAAGLPFTGQAIAEYAHVQEGTIVVDNYLQSDPFGKMPWPETR
jgi:septum site-determining protein MinC